MSGPNGKEPLWSALSVRSVLPQVQRGMLAPRLTAPFLLAVGAVLAFSLVWGGPGSVVWADPIATFPYYKGLVPVVVSWCLAPLSAMAVAAATFLTNRWGEEIQLVGGGPRRGGVRGHCRPWRWRLSATFLTNRWGVISLPPSLPRRTLILRQPNSTVLAFWALPALVFKTIIIDIFFILYKVCVDTARGTWVAIGTACVA